MPVGAKVKGDGTVTWTVKGKRRPGKISKAGNVSLQVDTWTAQFTDEKGKIRKVATKVTDRAVAEKMLVKYEREVDRIRTGVLTREELAKAEAPQVTLEEALERFETSMLANGCVPKYIKTTKDLVSKILGDCGIKSLADICLASIILVPHVKHIPFLSTQPSV
jgi:hypothetical protein